MSTAGLIVACIVSVLVTLLAARPRWFARRDPDAPLRALLAAVRGDRALAARLARHELDADPSIGTVEAMRRATRRVASDR